MPKTLDQIKQLTTKLVELGEDPEEFELWLSIYENMSPKEQLELGQILDDELKELTEAGQQTQPVTP